MGFDVAFDTTEKERFEDGVKGVDCFFLLLLGEDVVAAVTVLNVGEVEYFFELF